MTYPTFFSGTLVVQGKGTAQVLSIGINTTIGRIGSALASIKPETTHIKLEIHRVVKVASWAGFVLAGFVVLWYGLMRGGWLNGFLSGTTLVMAILPEELPVILTIFLGLGVWRMAYGAKKRANTTCASYRDLGRSDSVMRRQNWHADTK